MLDSETKKTIGKKCFKYYEYFTEKGLFLEDPYHQHLNGFLRQLKK